MGGPGARERPDAAARAGDIEPLGVSVPGPGSRGAAEIEARLAEIESAVFALGTVRLVFVDDDRATAEKERDQKNFAGTTRELHRA